MSRFESASGAYWDSRYRASSFPYGVDVEPIDEPDAAHVHRLYLLRAVVT